MNLMFTRILNMSMTASVVILLVLAMRFLLRGEPKIYSYALWAVVLFRLLCSVSLTGDLSLLGFASSKANNYTRLEQTAYGTQTYETERYSTMNYIPVEITVAEPETEEVAEVEKAFDWKVPGAYLWLAGVLAMVGPGVWNFGKLKKQLSEAIHWKKEVYLTDQIQTPFVLGLWKPKIYLPIALDEWERVYILAHERHHIRRGDPIFKLLAYVALCLHWFNPLVWLAFRLAEKDMEMSCDEAVIRRLGPEIRADYARSLLRLSTGHRKFTGMPLAFGEGDTKGRVKNMTKWKKPSVWMTIVCLVLCIGIGLFCALNPKQDIKDTHKTYGPASCGNGDLNYEIPEGCTIETAEEQTTKNCGNSVFTDGTNIIGGVNVYNAPDMTQEDWWTQLGLQEYEDGLSYFGCDWAGGIWSVEFFTETPEGTPRTVDREHFFFLSEDGAYVYDMWFDLLTVDPEVEKAILDSACVENRGVSTRTDSAGATIIKYEDFRITLSSGMSLDGEDITMDGKTVGGLKLRQQEKANDPNMFSTEWMAAIGVPEASDPDMGYMSNGSNYADYEVNFFLDVPVERDEAGNIIPNEAGNAVLDREVTHYFFVNGLDVYDLWFYNNRLASTVVENVLQSCSIMSSADVPESETGPEVNNEEAILQQCADVMSTVLNSDRQLHCVAVGPGYTYTIVDTYKKAPNGDCLHLEQVDGERQEAFLVLMEEQKYYHGTAPIGEELQWEEVSFEEFVQLPQQGVLLGKLDMRPATYDATITNDTGTSHMFTYHEPYMDARVELSNQNDEFQLTFYFDPQGNFEELRIVADYKQGNWITVTESIVSMEEETVNTAIEQALAQING